MKKSSFGEPIGSILSVRLNGLDRLGPVVGVGLK